MSSLYPLIRGVHSSVFNNSSSPLHSFRARKTSLSSLSFLFVVFTDTIGYHRLLVRCSVIHGVSMLFYIRSYPFVPESLQKLLFPCQACAECIQTDPIGSLNFSWNRFKSALDTTEIRGFYEGTGTHYFPQFQS